MRDQWSCLTLASTLAVLVLGFQEQSDTRQEKGAREREKESVVISQRYKVHTYDVHKLEYLGGGLNCSLYLSPLPLRLQLQEIVQYPHVVSSQTCCCSWIEHAAWWPASRLQ
jgi:hypothetical protein